MPSNPELLKQIETALVTFGTAPLLDASLGLFDTLGYRSERRMKLRSNKRTLETVTSRIFQGIKTSADKIYIVEERRRTKSKLLVYSPQTEREHEVEADLFHPLIKGGDSRAYLLSKTDRLILFPYAADPDGSTTLIAASTLRKNYPLTWAYLTANKKYLEEREEGRMKHDGWYGY